MVVSLLSRQRHANKFGLFLVVLLSWYTVFGLNCKPKDCIDLKCYRVSTADGGAMIYPESISFTKIEVTCKQTGDGGGWIVYLRRLDGSLSFKRTWDDYKSGFGEQGERKESWLGNENVYQLIKSFIYRGGLAQLRIEAYGFNGTSCVTTFDKFHLKDETDCYMLLFGNGVGSYGGVVDDWIYSRARHFVTFDRIRGHDFCFKKYSGGWWYGSSCHQVYFTGTYVQDNDISTKEFYIKHFKMPLKAVDMLFRPMRADRACNNPCNNGGTCEYIEATDNYRCVCPETHCGAKCETDNPCKHNGTCAYSLDTKQISCVCVGSHTGTHCDATSKSKSKPEPESKPQTGAKGANIAVASLLVVLVVGGIVTGVIVGKKRLARKEEEHQKLLLAEQEKAGLLGYLFS